MSVEVLQTVTQLQEQVVQKNPQQIEVTVRESRLTDM